MIPKGKVHDKKTGQLRNPCWREMPDGTFVKSGKPLVPDYARSYRRPNACFGRLVWSDIVPTVVCRPEPHNRPIIHPDEDRILSIRARIRHGI